MEEFLSKDMNLSKWIKIKDAEYEREHPPDFMTHFHYVECLSTISSGLSVECKLDIKNKIEKESKFLQKKLNLLNLIRRNLHGEYETIRQNPSFAEVCVPWVAVKTYYLIFNLVLILEYLICVQESLFNSSHEVLLKKLKDHLEKKELIFSQKFFNDNFQCSKIVKARAKRGFNLKMININLSGRIAQVLRKLIGYKLEDFQRKNRIKDFRLKKDQQKKKEFLDNNTVNLCEFFYWYRIKSNYRDLEFLDKDISEKQFNNFYRSYLQLAVNFYQAFKKLINDLAKIRLGKEIL